MVASEVAATKGISMCIHRISLAGRVAQQHLVFTVDKAGISQCLSERRAVTAPMMLTQVPMSSGPKAVDVLEPALALSVKWNVLL